MSALLYFFGAVALQALIGHSSAGLDKGGHKLII